MTLNPANRLTIDAYRREMGLPPVEPAPEWRGTGARRVDPIPAVSTRAHANKTKSIKVGAADPMPDGCKGAPTLADLIRPPLATRPLKPEEQLSHDVAWMLYAMAKQGRLRALPVCASTERNGGDNRAIVGRLVKRLIGAWPGQTDWVFVGLYFGVLELKERHNGRLSAAQRDCEAVCRSMGIPHAVAHTVEEARRALEEMGVIEGKV